MTPRGKTAVIVAGKVEGYEEVIVSVEAVAAADAAVTKSSFMADPGGSANV